MGQQDLLVVVDVDGNDLAALRATTDLRRDIHAERRGRLSQSRSRRRSGSDGLAGRRPRIVSRRFGGAVRGREMVQSQSDQTVYVHIVLVSGRRTVVRDDQSGPRRHGDAGNDLARSPPGCLQVDSFGTAADGDLHLSVVGAFGADDADLPDVRGGRDTGGVAALGRPHDHGLGGLQVEVTTPRARHEPTYLKLPSVSKVVST